MGKLGANLALYGVMLVLIGLFSIMVVDIGSSSQYDILGFIFGGGLLLIVIGLLFVASDKEK